LSKTPTNVSDFTNDANYITGMTILSYDPSSSGAESYRKLAAEILGQMK
jgi:cellulose biosynthesis protein BcsQ